MSTKRGLQIVLALIAVLISGAIIDARGQDGLRCEQGACTVPIRMLQELIRQAELADSYAAMCNWPKR